MTPFRDFSLSIAMLSVLMLAACGGGGSSSAGSTSSIPSTPTPTATFGPRSTSVASGATTQAPFPDQIVSIGDLVPALFLTTSSTWPSGVTVTASVVNTAPSPQGSRRITDVITQSQNPIDVAAWQLTFSGATGLGSLTSAPSIGLGENSIDPHQLLFEMFDVTTGLPPVLFTYSATSGSWVAQGATFQIALGDTYVVELVWQSAHLPQSQTFAFTGAAQTFVVPSTVTSVTITATGASGGFGAQGGYPGGGGATVATIAVTPGATLNIFVGGAGGNGTLTAPYAGAGGFNGGGAGSADGSCGGGGGGGASDVRIGGGALTNRVIVGAGGGGAGCNPDSSTAISRFNDGANGGGLVGSSSSGAGGTQSTGGAAGTAQQAGNTAGAPGVLGAGGAGGAGGTNAAGTGGGGAGLYGGGGGGGGFVCVPPPMQQCTENVYDGGGGGGSSFAIGSASNVTLYPGTGSAFGNGSVTINYIP